MSVPSVPEPIDHADIDDVEIDWEEPIPLRPRFFHRRSFPTDALPQPFRQMVEAVAELTQTDPAMAGVTVLSVLAAAAGGCAEVEPLPGWFEPLGLFTVVIAGPGERKSAVQASLIEPIINAESELATQSKSRRLESETLKEIAVRAADKARADASKITGEPRHEAEADAVSAAIQAEEIGVPPIARLIADDVTPESAASLIAEHQRIAIISAEVEFSTRSPVATAGVYRTWRSSSRATLVTCSGSIARVAHPSSSSARA